MLLKSLDHNDKKEISKVSSMILNKQLKMDMSRILKVINIILMTPFIPHLVFIP